MISTLLFTQAFANKSSAPALMKFSNVLISLHMVSSGTGASSTSGECASRHTPLSLSNI